MRSIRERSKAQGDTKEDVLDLLDMIERGFDDIEHRIANMDKEHTKYVRATVTTAELSAQWGDGHEGAGDPAAEPHGAGRRL